MEKFARVKNGVVENIEMATPEWVDENQGVDGFQFVVVSENDRPWVGYSYDSETGKFDGPCGCGEGDLIAQVLEIDPNALPVADETNQ